MEKLNIARLLKDCPKGMRLDCTIYEDVTLIHILEGNAYPIKIETPDGQVSLNKYGQYSNNKLAKCIIFPKGKTTWEGFQRPFEDGDILFVKSVYSWIIIYKESENKGELYKYVGIHDYPNYTFMIYGCNPLCCKDDISEIRPATEEEKEKLFKAIKDNGYKWNSETKTLDKLIEPKFKVGDKIKHKVNKTSPFTITEITDTSYKGGYRYEVLIEQQDNFELVPNKFDINTLKPFDKVLVRMCNLDIWECEIFSMYSDKYYKFHCIVSCYNQCIPYEGNEPLLGTTDDCDEYYKTW